MNPKRLVYFTGKYQAILFFVKHKLQHFINDNTRQFTIKKPVRVPQMVL